MSTMPASELYWIDSDRQGYNSSQGNADFPGSRSNMRDMLSRWRKCKLLRAVTHDRQMSRHFAPRVGTQIVPKFAAIAGPLHLTNKEVPSVRVDVAASGSLRGT